MISFDFVSFDVNGFYVIFAGFIRQRGIMDFRGNVSDETNVSSKAIRRKVKNTLAIALTKFKIESYNLVDLDKVLNDVYCSFRPVSAYYDIRKELVRSLNDMTVDIYGDSEEKSHVLEAYGSFVMDMYTSQSDLDVSINFVNGTSEVTREKKIQILERFAEKLRSLEGEGHVRNVESMEPKAGTKKKKMLRRFSYLRVQSST
ncbi:PREDICTED: uncharacterized protein LOC109129598 isoform X2 [Camelina sativa]|uniref:Uncharacterized protein LOC109129598 isoform X2 n=1 Tax=Camelina sativa TaxID=90675 RepID=A0ABM1R3K1_CAMSA|nr:PREDICTED: uncharacterized protein LOC109129598 isoform X2 [Camelina sativa]